METSTASTVVRTAVGTAASMTDGAVGSRQRRGCCGRDEGGVVAFLMTVMTLMTFVVLFVGEEAFAHEDPRMIPDGSDPVVRWYQPPGSPLVLDWDVEATPFEPDGVPTVFPAEAVPDESCWALHVDTQEPLRVRVRAVQNGAVSAWSDYTVVPEPDFALTLAVAVPLLVIASRRRPRSRGTPRNEIQLPRRTITFFVWV